MSWFVCMNMWSIFLMKHGFQSCVVHVTLAQSGAQTIYNLLQNANNIFNDWRRCGISNMFINRRGGDRNMSIKIIFSKIYFHLKVIKAILFFKELFSFKTKSSFKDKTSFFSRQYQNHFYSSKFHFPLK